MATKWISLCDFCGKEEVSGDKIARQQFGIPEQPANAYFRYTQDGTSDELKLDLCGECGDGLRAHLKAFVPDHYWNADEDDG